MSDTTTAKAERRFQAHDVMKVVAVLPKVLKLAKSWKALLLLLSFGGYSLVFGWVVAVGVLGLIAIHEWGHVWAMRRAGIRTRGMYFLPFMGAVAIVDQNLKSRWQEWWLTIMGPVFGTVGVLLLLGGFLVTGHQVMLALVVFGALINLVNLMPVLPLDGGRIVRSTLLSMVGDGRGFAAFAAIMLVGVVAAFKFGFGLLGTFGVIGFFELLGDYKRFERAARLRARAEEAGFFIAEIESGRRVQAVEGDGESTRVVDLSDPVDRARVLAELRTVRARAVEEAGAAPGVEPMRQRTAVLCLLAGALLAAGLAGLWWWATQEAGVAELSELFS